VAGEFLYQQSEILVVSGLFVSLLVAGEAGFRLGRRTRADTGDAIRSQIGTIEGGILGLLGLLLGFTFSMAVSRFDTRKRMAVEEANAIGTAALRGQMLPQPHRTEVADLFRRYVDVRVEVSRDAGVRGDSDARANRLQEQLWAQAVAGAAKDPRAIPTGLFILHSSFRPSTMSSISKKNGPQPWKTMCPKVCCCSCSWSLWLPWGASVTGAVWTVSAPSSPMSLCLG
jgi:hypothetical protein